MNDICISKGALIIAVLFNACASGYMLWYFYTSLRNLKKTLTKLQISERRRVNGIGMTELMICLNLQILVTSLVSICYVVDMFKAMPFIAVLLGFVPTLATGWALRKMLMVVRKVRNDVKVG